ncbi:O-fucosyltransferase 36-like [Prosopis cineraria]|uniref:O-fucosyltransferase 36-like n=1 Tax=Prosopis cineraria TaxID=364024 RepID=UPI00240EC095|nr:O-fucosyltransferase 36-like [Prosopis cineraria]
MAKKNSVQRDSSSDEEDDRHNLIDQNERKPPSPTAPTTPTTFHMENFSSRIPRSTFNFKFQKRYLFAILPLFIILFYFTTDPHSLFPTHLSSLKFDSFLDRMKESELRALYLLRQQHLGLLGVWNRTSSELFSSSVNSSINLNSSSQMQGANRSPEPLLEDLKSVLFKQISLNREIQEILLSPHRTVGLFEPEFDFGNDSFGGGVRYDRCRTVDQQFSQRRTIEWKPKADKFLLAICVSGQMSNHLICLEKHMFFAALLNRVLVIPSHRVDYQYDRVLDIDHINKCLGRKVVISFEEFSNIEKHHMHINKFLCYFSLPQPCFLDEERLKKLKSLGLSFTTPQPVWEEDTRKPKKRTVQDVLSKFTHDDDVMAIGDVFFAAVEQEWLNQPGGPIAHQCKTLIEPSRLILVTAQRFIQTFLGKNFIALHFRRHGFLKFCNVKKPSCFYPIPQAADCILRVVERANAPVIYLSTDAAGSETGLLQSLVVLNGKPVPLVKRPARNSAEKWDALLYRHHIEGDSQVEAMLDKTICALSSVFIGASGSTFTEDILRLRKGWGSASLCDEYLCQGEEPNIVAELE